MIGPYTIGSIYYLPTTDRLTVLCDEIIAFTIDGASGLVSMYHHGPSTVINQEIIRTMARLLKLRRRSIYTLDQ